MSMKAGHQGRSVSVAWSGPGFLESFQGSFWGSCGKVMNKSGEQHKVKPRPLKLHQASRPQGRGEPWQWWWSKHVFLLVPCIGSGLATPLCIGVVVLRCIFCAFHVGSSLSYLLCLPYSSVWLSLRQMNVRWVQPQKDGSRGNWSQLGALLWNNPLVKPNLISLAG